MLATVSSRFCFCWLYRASPSLAAKNIINLILVLTIWWCPCVESFFFFKLYIIVLVLPRILSCVVRRSCLLPPVCSLGKILLAFDLLHFVLQVQTYMSLSISWRPTFAFQSSKITRTYFMVLVLQGLVCLHRTVWLFPSLALVVGA